MSLRLYHVSESPDIKQFNPREPTASWSELLRPVVWAVDEQHLAHYLLPRDCPRVCAYIGPDTSTKDKALLSAKRMIALEKHWYKRAAKQTLYLYTMPTKHFVCQDANAGYYTSFEPIVPESIETELSPLQRLIEADIELRIVPDLWLLRERVIHSTLQFSCIRMRNAKKQASK